MFYSKSNGEMNLKNISKGTTIEINLEKQFIPGDQFILNNIKFKVVSKTKKMLKIVAL